MKKYPEYKQLDLSAINKEILTRWQLNSIFEKSLSTREGNPSYTFYEGPPSANGMPGIHHVMGRAIKDIFCRFKTLQGYKVNRKAGWDTHGLPVELGVEKELGITKEDIGTTISIEDYIKFTDQGTGVGEITLTNVFRSGESPCTAGSWGGDTSSGNIIPNAGNAGHASKYWLYTFWHEGSSYDQAHVHGMSFGDLA